MSRTKKDIIREYSEPDRFAWINEGDEILYPIRIELLMPKNIEKVQGFGMPKEEQMFEYEKRPRRLEYLEADIRDKVRKQPQRMGTRGKYNPSIAEEEQIFNEVIWDTLYDRYDDYKEEVEWIKSQWYYRLYGKWYFINGKLTYLNGWNWFYLNYWNLEGAGLPEYRDRDRRWFHAQRYAKTTTEKPKRNKSGELVFNGDGSIAMENGEIRTLYGTNNLKSRRVGETSKSQSIGFNIVTLGKEQRGGIQGDTEATSSDVFSNKLVFPFRKLPFFFRPTVMNPVPKSELIFDSKDYSSGIQSKMDFATTVKRTFYDGTKLNFVHVDEAGKLDSRESVHDRHEVLKRCMYQGLSIIGFMIYTSTVEDMSLMAGKEFLRLAESSHFQNRNDSGRTSSGLINVFFKATDGLEGFVGPYGESIIDTPTPRQVEYLKEKIKNKDGEYMGAHEYIMSDRTDKRRNNDIEGLTILKRLHPLSYKEAFTPPARNTFFNMDIIENRVSDLQFDNTKTLQGDFTWESTFGGRVRFVEKDGGRFSITKRLDENEANSKIKKGSHWHPQNHYKYIASGDAFRLEKSQGGVSDGGGAVMRVHDDTIDPPGTQPKDFKTNKFVCAYRYKPPTPEDYVEDMLKMCIYYGAYIYPENNIDEIERRFKEWGFKGFLLYETDIRTGKKKGSAGFFTGGGSKQGLFNRGIEFIDNHGAYCDIIEILEEFGEISGLDDLTNYDLLTSVFGCLRGQEEVLRRTARRDQFMGVDVGGTFGVKLY